MICDREVKFGEDIDIASLPRPKARIVTLEPLNKRRRSKPKPKKRAATASSGAANSEPRKSGSMIGSDGTATQRGSTTTGSQVDGDTPMSPAPSEISFDSCMSSAGTGSAVESAAQSALSNGSSKVPGGQQQSSQRPISTSIEISRAGFLRGDTVQIRVGIQHRKLVRSLHGVIVTFYRLARVDMNPSLPVITRDGKEGKAEDYYPKSKTGLGGLSLSAAGSSHVFRKDLSQSFAALIVNPETMTADIKATVRVPDEAFPSIASVPGSMISFKYYVEILLDIQGKLTGLDRLFPSAGNQYGPGAGTNVADGGNNAMMSAWGGHFIDTQDIRREKSVIPCLFDVVIGTRDSQRVQGVTARQAQPSTQSTNGEPLNQAHAAEAQQAREHPNEDPTPYEYSTNSYYDEQWQYDGYGYAYDDGYGNGYGNGYHDQQHDHLYGLGPPPLHSVPLPDLSEENQLPEKERLRRAEERLLPSQPPDGDEGESSGDASRFAPSAPHAEENRVPAEAHNGGPEARATQTSSLEPEHPSSSTAAPAYSGPSHPDVAPSDDKQELQRQRLELGRSAPDEEPANDNDEAAGPSAPNGGNDGDSDLAPSAPPLHDDGDDLQVGGSFSPLPKYER